MRSVAAVALLLLLLGRSRGVVLVLHVGHCEERRGAGSCFVFRKLEKAAKEERKTKKKW